MRIIPRKKSSVASSAGVVALDVGTDIPKDDGLVLKMCDQLESPTECFDVAAKRRDAPIRTPHLFRDRGPGDLKNFGQVFFRDGTCTPKVIDRRFRQQRRAAASLRRDARASCDRALNHAMEHDDSIDRACGETEPGVADRRGDTPGVYHTIPNFDARRADALVAMAEHYLNDPRNGSSSGQKRGSSSADRYQVVVHVSAEALQDVPAGTSLEVDRSHLERGPRLPAETSRRLACDCAIVPPFEDADGEPLSIGRKSRSIPPAIRRALRARDKGCRFPGCINHYRLDGHHIEHWANGGETRLDNLLQLCWHHHRLVHEGGFSCERITVADGDDRIVFRDQYGRVIADGHVPETAVDTTDEVAWFEQYLADVDIDSETCVTRWEGERIDWPLAVGHLFH